MTKKTAALDLSDRTTILSLLQATDPYSGIKVVASPEPHSAVHKMHTIAADNGLDFPWFADVPHPAFWELGATARLLLVQFAAVVSNPVHQAHHALLAAYSHVQGTADGYEVCLPVRALMCLLDLGACDDPATRLQRLPHSLMRQLSLWDCENVRVEFVTNRPIATFDPTYISEEAWHAALMAVDKSADVPAAKRPMKFD